VGTAGRRFWVNDAGERAGRQYLRGSCRETLSAGDELRFACVQFDPNVQRIIDALPSMPQVARSARRFLVDAVQQLVTVHGVRQFLDIGGGLPTADNTHEVAQRLATVARVVYVDHDRCQSGCVHAC
jgi:S-adenosyl methyltransferase